MDRWRKCMKSRQIIELGNWKAWYELGSAGGRGRAELAQILNVCSRVNETAWWKWTGQQRNHGSHPAVKWSWRGLGAFCSQIHEMPWASSLGEHQHGSLGDGIKQKPKRSWWNLQQNRSSDSAPAVLDTQGLEEVCLAGSVLLGALSAGLLKCWVCRWRLRQSGKQWTEQS